MMNFQPTPGPTPPLHLPQPHYGFGGNVGIGGDDGSAADVVGVDDGYNALYIPPSPIKRVIFC